MSQQLKEKLRVGGQNEGFEFFGVVDAAELAKAAFPSHRCLDTPQGFLPEAKSVAVFGMHIWDPLFNAVVTSVLPDGAIPFDDVPGAQYYNLYYELTEARAHRVAQVLRDAGYKAVVTHFVHAKVAAHLAGLGWIGKHTLVITPLLGPRVRWCCIVTDAVMPYDKPYTRDLCEGCDDLCIKACPTDAIMPGYSQGVEPGKKIIFDKCIVPDEMRAEPSESWQKYAKKYTRRGVTECLICHDACPVGKEEHERRLKEYTTKPKG